MNSVDITNLVGSDFPYSGYVCTILNTNCVFVGIINTPIPPTITFTLPSQYLYAPAVGFKLVNDECEKFEILYCS